MKKKAKTNAKTAIKNSKSKGYSSLAASYESKVGELTSRL
jgi:hypothetical protein